MILLLAILTIIVVILDITRHKSTFIQNEIDFVFSYIIRKSEASGSKKLSGASFMFISFFITALLFDKYQAIASWVILIISDSLAAILGRMFGTPLKNSKSIIGSIGFFVPTLIITLLYNFLISPPLAFIKIIVISLITTILEFYSTNIKINDNLLIPLVYCSLLKILF